MDSKKLKKIILWCIAAALLFYGAGRLYYRTTGGFMQGNITYDLPYDSRWDLYHPESIDELLMHKFHYLGKGCQSYVFSSDDGKHVIKFFKYQRFRPQAWLSFFSFIPPIEDYRLAKIEKKRQKLESVFMSWKIAYEDLQPETGVVFVHLNKSKNLQKTLVIYDKIGLEYKLNADDYEFLIQKKAQMLCPALNEMMAKGDSIGAKQLLDRLFNLLLSEYHRGFADNDHALMQNTGVVDGYPVHIDVGQFVKNQRASNPDVYHQELFNKTWKFRKWLEKNHRELADHLVFRLEQTMGKDVFASLKPRLNKASMGVLSHHDD